MSSSTSRKRKLQSEPEEAQDEAEEMEWSDEDGGTRVDGIYIPPPQQNQTVHRSETRLIITRITNNFFKSYADNVVLGPFSKCFNAIIGPNGSGKSNVIDSMLFVFGYRATKIRSKKISVLLHNSEKYRNVQACTVSVHFCEIIDKPGDTFEKVPGSDFVISRTAHKDNSSYYQLNNRKVQFKEVAQLLKKHGIDLDHNRFLILQGEVEEIATMKCKGANENETGMLEYLEDIIGTNKYKKPLAQLSQRIETLLEQRTEKLNRVNLIRKELDELKGPMEEALGFLKLENTVSNCRNILYQKTICDLENDVQDINADMQKAIEERDKLNSNLEALANEKAEKEAALQEQISKCDGLNKRKEKLKEAFGKAEKKDLQLQAEMTQLNNNRKKYKEQLAEEKKKLSELERIPEKNQATIIECENKEKELLIKKEKLDEEKTKLLTNLRSETKDLQIQKEKLETKLEHLKKTVNETKSAFDLAEAELKLCQSSEENEQRKLSELQGTIEENEKLLKQRTEEVANLRKKIPLTEKSLSQAVQQLNAVKAKEAELHAELKKKRITLEENRASMQSSRSRGRVLDSLMQQKREGNCTGLYGRLGDLGAIDQKYDVAISTACGPLDNIVVDTVTTAQWCIEFLKKHGIGRATFIALDKQEHLRQQANSKIKTPENVHRLFDLIKIQDETVRTAFYYALRDTLVAEDLDQASRIAYGAQRYRVVTLRGDLIETSGTMSGGGRNVSKGRMGQSVVTSNINPKDIEKMQEELNRYEEQLRSLIQEQGRLESQVNTLEPELNQMKINLQKYTRDLEALKEQQPSLIEQFKRQEKVAKSTKADPQQVQRLTAVMDIKKKAYDKASEAAEEVQVDVDQLTMEIKEKTSGKMQAVDKSLNEVTKTMDKCKAEITRLKVAITTSARNAKKSAEKITTLEQNIIDAENNLRQMKAQREEIEEDGRKMLEAIKEIAEQLDENENGDSDLKEEVKRLTKEENKLKLKKVDVDQIYKTIKEKLNNCNASIHEWHARLKQLKLHAIESENVEPLKVLSPEELAAINVEEIELQLQTAQGNIKNLKPNLGVLEEYKKGQKIFAQRSLELDEVTSKRNEMKSWFDKVKTQRKNEFMVGYNLIKMKLKEMYQMITLGGDADFEIVDSYDPFSEGIQFNVRPPRKSWKSISNLSGGEKTLSSLALVFALHYYKPSPLYVMDEIDAALDFKNVSIVGNYIKERTKNAQFVIISLRSNMFELCDNLIGIYKIQNCTRTITINPKFFDEDNAVNQLADPQQHAGDGDANPVNGDLEETPSNETSEHNTSSATSSQVLARSNGVIDDSFDEPLETMDSSD